MGGNRQRQRSEELAGIESTGEPTPKHATAKKNNLEVFMNNTNRPEGKRGGRGKRLLRNQEAGRTHKGKKAGKKGLSGKRNREIRTKKYDGQQ